jgi:hypothetical protein
LKSKNGIAYFANTFEKDTKTNTGAINQKMGYYEIPSFLCRVRQKNLALTLSVVLVLYSQPE